MKLYSIIRILLLLLFAVACFYTFRHVPDQPFHHTQSAISAQIQEAA